MFFEHEPRACFDSVPALLILKEAWLFLDEPSFTARIRQWLKTSGKNVNVIFATQLLADNIFMPAIWLAHGFLPLAHAVG
ncbi:hypothetical protein C5188_09155 [Serratia liquefaciens]|nr:hypothetical protein C5188_09155 [Serratia liquefaciens]QHT50773.1 hypothetical protein C5686_010720 [Serratia liquefaciens]